LGVNPRQTRVAMGSDARVGGWVGMKNRSQTVSYEMICLPQFGEI